MIAREIALDLADFVHNPDQVSHVAGVANSYADELSRRFQPGRAWKFPAPFLSASRVPLGERTSAWWRTLVAPLYATRRRVEPSGVPFSFRACCFKNTHMPHVYRLSTSIKNYILARNGK